MSKNRNLMILAAVLVALAAVSILQKVGRERATSRPADAPLLAGKIDRDALRRLEIGRGTDAPVVLVNGPAGWEVASRYHHPASDERVQTLLTDLEGLRGEFRSDAADVLVDYGLTDSTAVVIRGYAEAGADTAAPSAPVFALQVGERPRGGVGNFVRLPGSTAVYLTQAGILNDLGLYSGLAAPEAKHFLALDAFQVERDDVDAIRIFEGGDLSLAMEKEFPPSPAAAAAQPAAAAGPDGAAPAASDPADATMAATDQVPDRQTYEWRLTAPQRKAALKTKADAVLGALVTIRAADVADPAGDPALYGLAEPERRVVVVTKDGKQRELLIGSQREDRPDQPGGFYFQIAGERPVYVIRQYQVDNICKQPKDLLPES